MGQRFTSHGDIVYEKKSTLGVVHPFWQHAKDYWPGEMTVGCPGCHQSQAAPPPPVPAFNTLDEWFAHAQSQPSDFNEHMGTLKDLASKSEVCVELSLWMKPALLAMAAGRPKDLVSCCPNGKGQQWEDVKKLLQPPTTFRTESGRDALAVKPFPCDLFFPDTQHDAEWLWSELQLWAPHCRHWIAIHTTQIYGEQGDLGKPGVLVALRRFIRENPTWGVVDDYVNNYGLTILSCRDEDKQPCEVGAFKKVANFTKAMIKWKASGLPVLDEDKAGARLDACALCKHRRPDDSCAKCGCPLIEGAAGVPGKAFIPTEPCPIGRWPVAG